MSDSLTGYLIAGAAGFVAALVLFLLFGRGRAKGNMLTSDLSAPLGSTPPRPLPPHKKSTLELGRELAPEIEELLRDGKKAAAVKLVRDRTGLGLKESLQTVETLEKLLKII